MLDMPRERIARALSADQQALTRIVSANAAQEQNFERANAEFGFEMKIASAQHSLSRQ